MMTAVGVDVDSLRRALRELGYSEYLDVESAPLVHRILSDLNHLATQYTSLTEDYDHLATRLQEETQPKKDTTLNKAGGSYDGLLDTSFLSSFPGMASTGDESFMLQAVEQARSIIDQLTTENRKLTDDLAGTAQERDKLAQEVQKLQLATQELSQLLNTKASHLETTKKELDGLKRQWNAGVGQQLGVVIRTAIALLPVELQSSYSAKMSDTTEGQLACLQDIINRLSKETQASSSSAKSAQAMLDKLKKEHNAAEDAMVKMKAGIAQYQSQIAELNARLHQKEFENSLQADIALQIKAMNGVNEMLKEKVAVLERLKMESAANANGEMAQVTVQALLESLSAELNTEVCFSSHLNQLIEKLNQKRLEQEKELADAHQKLREAQSSLSLSESEKIDLKSRLDRAQSDLLNKDGAVSTSGEAMSTLKQAVEAKQARIEEQKRSKPFGYCVELKAALDQCQLAMATMRRNEELIRQHALTQDEEIRKLKSLNEQLSSSKNKSSDYYQKIENEVAILRSGFREKSEENQRLTAELKTALAAQEKALMDLRTTKDSMADLENSLQAKRKEKDLLMTTYCRVIKDNEKLHADLQKLQEEHLAMKIGDGSHESTLKALQTKALVQQQENDRLKTALATQESKVREMESKLDDTMKTIKRFEDELADKQKEASHLRGVISTLERSKKDLAGQMARFGQQASELRNHLRSMEAEKDELQGRLRSLLSDNPAVRQASALSGDLETTKSQLKMLEKEREMLSHQLQLERIKAEKLDQMLTEERLKRSDHEVKMQTLESSRNKLKEQLEMLNREQDKNIQSLRKQMRTLRDDNYDHHHHRGSSLSNNSGDQSDAGSNLFRNRRSARKGNLRSGLGLDSYEEDVHFGTKSSRLDGPADSITPSPPDSPKDLASETTDRLRVQNRTLKRHLEDIRREMKDNMTSPRRSAALEELETSLSGLTSSDDTGPTTKEISQNTAEMRRRLEQENKILFKIVDKVRGELMKAGIDSPPTLTSSSSS